MSSDEVEERVRGSLRNLIISVSYHESKIQVELCFANSFEQVGAITAMQSVFKSSVTTLCHRFTGYDDILAAGLS